MPGVETSSPSMSSCEDRRTGGIPGHSGARLVSRGRSGRAQVPGARRPTTRPDRKRAVQALKREFPGGCDHRRGPSTRMLEFSHGQDGLIDESGYVLNDETLGCGNKQALSPRRGWGRRGGAVGHDGWPHRPHPPGFETTPARFTPAFWRPGQIRFEFLRPFRDAVGSAANPGKQQGALTRWTPPTATRPCARWRWTGVRGRHGDGRPACLPGHRAPVKDEFMATTYVYQVSGEYAMKGGGPERLAQREARVPESLVGLQAGRGRSPDLFLPWLQR